MVDHARLAIRPRRLAVHAGTGGTARGAAEAGLTRVPDAVQRSPGDAKHRPVRCSAEPGPTHFPLRYMGPGSAAQRFTLRRVRGTRFSHTLLHHFTQRGKIRLARRGAAEHEADAAAGLRIFQPQEFYARVA